jgi:monooxygenase
MRASGQSECVARNDDPTVAEGGPLLGLTSGYIQRSAHLLPQQGSRQPWRVHQSYLRDYRALRMSEVDDGVMQFGRPNASVRPDVVTVAS